MRQNGKRQVSVYLEEEILDTYQRKYPYTMPNFLRNCIKIAIENEDWVYKIWTYNNKKEELKYDKYDN